MSEWKTIDSAPKDWSMFLAFRPGWAMSMAVCAWDSCEEVVKIVTGGQFIGATHWMPLPEPPQ